MVLKSQSQDFILLLFAPRENYSRVHFLSSEQIRIQTVSDQLLSSGWTNGSMPCSLLLCSWNYKSKPTMLVSHQLVSLKDDHVLWFDKKLPVWNLSSFLLNWRTCYKWKSSLRCPSLSLSSVSRCLIFSGMARMINKTSLILGALSSAGVCWVIPCDSVSLIGLIGPLNVGGGGAKYTCEKISHTSKYVSKCHIQSYSSGGTRWVEAATRLKMLR